MPADDAALARERQRNARYADNKRRLDEIERRLLRTAKAEGWGATRAESGEVRLP
jgi:hypothetical protein